MTEIRHFCDSCSERITSDRTALKVRCGPLRHHREEIDLCGACLGKLVAILSPTPPATLEAVRRDGTPPDPTRRGARTTIVP
jgi:hypothetical protein